MPADRVPLAAMIVSSLLCFWLVTSPSSAATSAPSDAVTIKHDEPMLDRVMFNRARPDPAQDMPQLKPGEAAITRSNYECRAGVGYEIIRKEQVGGHWHVIAHIGHVNVETRLTDTIYLPMMAPTLLRAHEEGHREMNERIYKEGDATLRSLAADVLSHDWEADGPDAEAAGKAATDIAVQHLCNVYLDATAGRASRLGDIYDRFTDHGRNQLYVANAIRLSFLEEQKLGTTRPGELIHPTTAQAE